MKNAFYIFLLLFLVCISCNRDVVEHEFISEFPIECTLVGQEINSLDTLYGLYSLASAGKWFISAEKKREYFFTLYDEDFNKVCHFAFEGRGMNEFIAPMYLGQYSIEQEQFLKLLIYDCALNKLDEVSIDVINKEVAGIETLLEVKAGLPLKSVFISKDSGCMGVTDNFNCKTFISDCNFSNIKTFAPSVQIDDRMEMHPFAQSYSCTDQRGEKMAVAYFNFPIIDIRKCDGSLIKSILLKKKYILPHHMSDENAFDYFIKILTYNGQIYALYNKPEEDTKSHVLIFDWDGNPIADYSISKAISFAVLENKLIVINEDQEKSMCTSYKLD